MVSADISGREGSLRHDLVALSNSETHLPGDVRPEEEEDDDDDDDEAQSLLSPSVSEIDASPSLETWRDKWALVDEGDESPAAFLSPREAVVRSCSSQSLLAIDSPIDETRLVILL
jgi:hypothetical protein